MKTVLKYVLATAVVLLFVVCGISAYFINYALGNGDRCHDHEAEWDSVAVRYPQLMRKWLVNSECDSIRVYIMSAKRPTARTAVLAHGYKDNGLGMMHICRMYLDSLDYNVVLYDQYAHGASSGDMIQMGWKDCKNLIMCARMAEEMFGDTIVLHGISMGGATVMMAGGDEELPHSVRAIVDDCGYTSVWDEYVGEMKKQFSLPPFPILHFTNLVNKLCFGWSFTEASSLDAVSRTKVPMLFIHGDNDTYVPTDMVYRLYDAHKGRKSLWLSPGSMHARSYDDHPADYTHKVREFLELE